MKTKRTKNLWTLWRKVGSKWKAYLRSKDKEYLELLRPVLNGRTSLLRGRQRPDKTKRR